jgi:ABC-type Mn2+/Zn2+ transport system permease subunit
MGDALIAPFADNEFLRLALGASLLVAVTCAIAGTFVVLRGLAFAGDAMSHGVLPGLAIALLLGVSPVLGAAASAAVMMAGVGLITRRSRLGADTAIGLLFVGMLALGVMITSRSESFVGDITRLLFGQLLGVQTADLAWQAVALAAVGSIAWVGRRPFVMMSVDEGLARTSGFRTAPFHALMLAMVGLTIVASFRTVGTLLVLGMLVAPAATGALVARRVSTVMLVGSACGTVASYAGLLVSYHFDLAAGSSVVLVAVALFGLTASVVAVATRGGGSAAPPHPHGAHHVA